MEFQKTARGHAKKSRVVISEKLSEFNQAKKTASQRKAANDVGVPRSTLRHWKSRASKIPLPSVIINCFESPEGATFLHHLVTAIQFVMTQVGACGIRLVCLVLEMANLHYFVATSYEALRLRGVEMEKQIIEFGCIERTRLANEMPHRKISVAEDETFHPKPCLVAIEPVSNFILLEEYSDKRDAVSWNKAMDEALKGLSVEIIQATSDEAKGIINHVEKHLGAHHSPDIFHVQQDVTRATSAAMASKVRSAKKELEVLENEFESRKAVNFHHSKLGRPSKLSEKNDQQLSEAIELAKNEVALCEAQQLAIREAKKGLSVVYHPYDLGTGQERHSEQVSQELNTCFDTIEKNVSVAQLKESATQKIAKAKRVCSSLIATLTFFWTCVREIIGSYALPLEIESLLYEKIIPAQYLLIAGKKSRTAEEREKIISQGKKLLSELEAVGIWKTVAKVERIRLIQIAIECANCFQRSSSCLEGRNGYLSLRHHGLHHISDRKLGALTVIHNYFIKRPDGSVAAERFFGKKPANLFGHLLKKLPYPPRPAQKRTKLAIAA